MRLIVACGHCRRQYDAAGVQAGSRFHCTCGEAVEVVAPGRGYDAAVVRCSACGAARAGTAASCTHCGSAFTLHERDLHTVCPQCAARVSDRAKFCHHCGQSLASTPIDSVATELSCPFCEYAPAMYHRTVGDPQVPVAECWACLGLWVDHDAVEELVRRAEGIRDTRQLLPPRTGEAERIAPTEGNWQYRKCPHCSVLMNRQNLGRASGVIVDTCGTHGVWFDDKELHALLDWVHGGGRAVSTRPRVFSPVTPAPTAASSEAKADSPPASILDWGLMEVLAFAASMLSD